jgi:hypothetical protein
MVMAGGRTNTLGEFRVMALRAGLQIVTAGPQATAGYVVECSPI